MRNENLKRTEIIHVAAQESDADGDLFDIRGLVQTIWRGKWIIAICAAIAVVMAVLIISQLDLRYKATASVMFDLQKTNVANVQNVLVDQEFSKDTLQNEIEVLRSTNLIERVVSDLRLERDPVFNPKLRAEKKTILDSIRNLVSMPPEVVDLLQGLGIMSPPPPPVDAERAARNERLVVIGNVRSGMTLSPVRGSRVINISFTSPKPELSARIVNSMADNYIVDQLQGKLEAAQSGTDWLAGRVQELEDAVKTSENRVAAARQELNEAAGQSLGITNQQLEALTGTLSVTRARLSESQAQFERLTSAIEDGLDLGAIPEFRDSALIQRFRQTESKLLSQEAVLKGTVQAGHPQLVRLQAQLDETRRNITAEAERVVTAIEIDFNALTSQEANLTAEVRDLEERAIGQSKNELQLRQLERKAQASRLLYENFLSRLQETNAQEGLQSADARILSPAEPPLQAVSQRKNLILLIGAVLGSSIGTALVFLMDRLNNTFRAPQQLSDMTGQTVLATIPAMGKRNERAEIIRYLREKPNSSLAESIRNLRTSILFSNVDNPPKVVMFTSSVPREGKSTTSMLMALTSRQMGKSAIIVDCDLRMPAVSKLLNVDNDKPGLLSLMDGTAEINDVIHKDEDTGLHVLMTRNSERQAQINAADVLSSQRFKDLISALSEHYELVILDTPPTLVVTDARIVSRLADAIVYAVRWDATPRDAVNEGLKELATVDADVTGVVMTMVNEARASSYAYDGYSYYKGRYRDYYDIS